MANTTDRLTNTEVGDRLGLSESGVSRIRSGNRMPSRSVVLRVKEEFHLSDRVMARWIEVMNNGTTDEIRDFIDKHVFTARVPKGRKRVPASRSARHSR